MGVCATYRPPLLDDVRIVLLEQDQLLRRASHHLIDLVPRVGLILLFFLVLMASYMASLTTVSTTPIPPYIHVSPEYRTRTSSLANSSSRMRLRSSADVFWSKRPA